MIGVTGSQFEVQVWVQVLDWEIVTFSLTVPLPHPLGV